jgi:hypothetical protein
MTTRGASTRFFRGNARRHRAGCPSTLPAPSSTYPLVVAVFFTGGMSARLRLTSADYPTIVSLKLASFFSGPCERRIRRLGVKLELFA